MVSCCNLFIIYVLIIFDFMLKGVYKKLMLVGNLCKLLVYKSCFCYYMEGIIFFFREFDYYMGKYEWMLEFDIMYVRSIIMLICKWFVLKVEL